MLIQLYSLIRSSKTNFWTEKNKFLQKKKLMHWNVLVTKLKRFQEWFAMDKCKIKASFKKTGRDCKIKKKILKITKFLIIVEKCVTTEE